MRQTASPMVVVAAALPVVGLISRAPMRAAAWVMVLASFSQVDPPLKELGQCHLHILRKRNIIAFNEDAIKSQFPIFIIAFYFILFSLFLLPVKAMI